MPDSFSLSARAKSFRYAARGVVHVLHSQHNAWIHAAATVAACSLGVALGISRNEWSWVVIAIVAFTATVALSRFIETTGRP